VTYTIKPLPFDPGSIPGLSEKLLVSHHQNNYGGAVNRLNAICKEFEALDCASVPGFLINGLKREELVAMNSMILHELYFGGLGDPSEPGPALARAIERDFGSFARWHTQFSAMGKSILL
jgi:Fe-Mn family superoxide dismutase